MLSHDIYQDSQVYEVFNELYEQEEMHFNDFISGYLSLFDWYPLNCQELSGLPSGFRVDLKHHSGTIIEARLCHIKGQVGFNTKDGIISDMSEAQWEIRLGVQHLLRDQECTSTITH
ncbi:hypothetical protein [Vibrio mediterranei]|uniref:Uncharacterized protein n=1 Tax=Vibrio mediterranei TaxID=689 RepID=A0ABX5D665_9VIBR|nr:hypothetical protein [Vibrio mediterranei]PRQ65159.1 hypothetical protein COR51_23855 [Vibrio mediterranei]